VWSFIHAGLVGFYDGASLHSNIKELLWFQSIGGGFRLLFPQFNRSVFRFDLGFPFASPSSSPYGLAPQEWTVLFSFGSGQAFSFMPWES
jgi:hypothetical protein